MNRRSSLVAAAMLGAFAASSPSNIGARVIERPHPLPDPSPPVPRKRRTKHGPRSNEQRKPSLKARKKHKAKIARASRRANMR